MHAETHIYSYPNHRFLWVLLTVFAVIGMGLTNRSRKVCRAMRMAINKSGTLRMQSYRFLSEILTTHSQQYL